MELLNVKNLTIRTGGQMPLVRGSSFYVQPGETLAIVGESGSGKSLSLLAVLGLLPDELQITGEITFNDLPLHTFSPKQKRRLRGAQIGYISQDPLSNLHPLKSVGRQIEEAILAHQKLSRKALRTRVESLLDEVGIPNASERYLDYPAKFSGGQRQRIMIAMAIALRPKLIIADEPTTALDATVQATILQLLKRLQQRYGCALIFISHNLRVVADIADRVAVMQRGKIVEQGSRNLMFSSPSHTYSQALLQAGFPPRATSEFKPSTTPLLEVSQLSRHYSLPSLFRKKNSDLTVLNSVSFTQYKGEIIGLVGESGSGKTTLGRILAGLDGADSGSVTLNGQLWHLPAPCHPQRHTVQMIFQDPYSSLNPRRTVADILAQPLQITALREHGKMLSSAELQAAIRQLMKQTEIPAELASRFPVQLSGGQRQRVVIARALAMKPGLIIADEAVSALDITTQRSIIRLLIRLREHYGLSILFISHDLDAVAALCDRVLVLQNGDIVEQGTTEQIFRQPRHEWTRRLLSAIPGAPYHPDKEVPDDAVFTL